MENIHNEIALSPVIKDVLNILRIMPVCCWLYYAKYVPYDALKAALCFRFNLASVLGEN